MELCATNENQPAPDQFSDQGNAVGTVRTGAPPGSSFLATPFPATLAPHLPDRVKFEKNRLANGTRSHPHGFSPSLRLQSVRRRGLGLFAEFPFTSARTTVVWSRLASSDPVPSSARTGRLCRQTPILRLVLIWSLARVLNARGVPKRMHS
jgi:hypothetical protein